MDSIKGERTTSSHVVAIPYPGRGHINAMMNACRILATSNGTSLLITFVVTEEWLGLIGSTNAPPNLRFQTIPNVIPSELVRGADFPGFIEAVHSKMEGPFEELLERLEPPAGFFVADTMLSWALKLGNRREIPVASFWPMAASMLSVALHFDMLASNGHFPINTSERGDERIDYIPGIPSIRLGDILPSRGKLENAHRLILGAVTLATKAKCLLLASFHELETQVIDILKANLPLPIYTLGPYILYINMTPENRVIGPCDMDYFNWLDSQPMSSVLYVSLGSHVMVSGEQMDEIAIGLGASGARFLWVVRSDAPRLQDLSGEMGHVVPWCDQFKVLCHSSIGGFLTHCGWNSTMESIFAGKIMLTFPFAFDQHINSKLIVEDLKIGMKLKNEEEIIKREEIARNVQRLMDSKGNERKEMRRRAREHQEACRRAIEKGGSSYRNLHMFVSDVLL
ncbi:hypothetical protein AAC387_Pa03g1143 [Persea americana]